ncbi:MAG: 5-formyltetrahydrofolate cyclo-ligase [Legionellales bacterium]|nr:5-formyltetrahydrofolate cyclo-ligase [Legionellales bacterium]
MDSKQEIRQNLIEKRANLTKQQVKIASEQLSNNIANLVDIKGKKISFYKSIENEINPQLAIKTALKLSVKCYLPKIFREVKKMSFVEYDDEQILIQNQFLIPEPTSTNYIEAPNLDIIFIPLVGFDQKGNRIGRGAGYYDRALAFKKDNHNSKPELIGLGYDFQFIEDFMPEAHDIKLDQAITDKRIYKFNSDNN